MEIYVNQSIKAQKLDEKLLLSKDVPSENIESEVVVTGEDTKLKFLFNEETRVLVWNILCADWETAKLENELK